MIHSIGSLAGESEGESQGNKKLPAMLPVFGKSGIIWNVFVLVLMPLRYPFVGRALKGCRHWLIDHGPRLVRTPFHDNLAILSLFPTQHLYLDGLPAHVVLRALGKFCSGLGSAGLHLEAVATTSKKSRELGESEKTGACGASYTPRDSKTGLDGRRTRVFAQYGVFFAPYGDFCTVVDRRILHYTPRS